METIVVINQLDKLNRYVYFDSYLLANKKFSSFYYQSLNQVETEKAINQIKRNNKKVYLLIDRVLFNEEIEQVKKYICKMEKLDVDGYFFSDLGVLKLLQDLNLIEKGIYYSQTQIVSALELKTFAKYGLKSAFVSKDYPLKNIIKNASKYPLGVNIFGYRNLFYSRRLLLSAYKDEFNLKDKFSYSNKYTIREQKRTTKSLIYEDKNGTYVFTDYIDNHLNHIYDFSDAFVKMVLIDDNFIEEDLMEKVLNFFKDPSKIYQLSEKEKDTYEQ